MRRPLRDRKPDGRIAAQLTDTVSAPSPAGLKTLWVRKQVPRKVCRLHAASPAGQKAGRVENAAQLTNTVLYRPSPAGLKTLWACKPCGTHVRKADPASRDKQPGRLISTKFSIPYGIKNPISALSEESVCRTGFMCTGPNPASGLPTTRPSIPYGKRDKRLELVCLTGSYALSCGVV
jgi:hypothetical protein